MKRSVDKSINFLENLMKNESFMKNKKLLFGACMGGNFDEFRK